MCGLSLMILSTQAGCFVVVVVVALFCSLAHALVGDPQRDSRVPFRAPEPLPFFPGIVALGILFLG